MATPAPALSALTLVTALRTMVETGVLDMLDACGPSSAVDLAARTHVSVGPLELMLEALAEGGVVARDPAGRWRVAGSAAAWRIAVERPTASFARILEGAKPPESSERSMIAGHHYAEMAGLLGCITEPIAAAMASSYARPDASLLELAAGDAPWSRAFLNVAPSMRATIVDRAPIIGSLRARRPELAATAAVTLIAGDVDEIELDESFDVVVISALCRLRSEDANRRLFERVAGWLDPAGELFVLDAVRDGRPRPGMALYELSLACRSRAGRVFSLEDYRRWLRSAGLGEPRLHDTELASHAVLHAIGSTNRVTTTNTHQTGNPTMKTAQGNDVHSKAAAGESDGASSDAPPTITFDPPGPGTWELDGSHQSAPRGRLTNEIVTDEFTEGFRSTFARYGLPLETIEARMVGGWMYTKVKPVGAPEGAGGGGAPPDIVLKIASRLLPELRRRNRTAKAALEQKLWLRDAETWASERPDWIAKGNALLSDPVATMSTDDLAAHVRTAVELSQRMLRRHFELVGPSVGAGRLLAAAEQWRLDRTATMDLLRGASPESAGTAAPLRAMAELVEATGAEPTTFEELRSLSPDIAGLADEYIAGWGTRVLGDTIEDPTLSESPDRLVELIKAAAGASADSGVSIDEAQRALRAQVPEPERDRFDQLVDEARQSYGSLDDNSGLTAWVAGIARRAVIEAARRAVENGRLVRQDDVWNLSVAELYELAAGGAGPSADDLVARRQRRRAATEPPAWLGAAPGPPPPASVFPGPMREMVEAFGAFLSGKFGDGPSGPKVGSGRLVIGGAVVASGHGVGTQPVTGRVVVADDAFDAMERLSPGDILVCPYTTASWNSVFPLLGGIVTAHGGPIGHTGVMAREFDLPAVIGVGTIESDWDGQTATLSPAPPPLDPPS